ncbi:MAG: hypothetical protein BAJALOKI1v1_1190009 [Promethearchaeota archaeon]|nr:MAG: hypothetical protein BAJALOKI1v1_1190009 [Candidatus Lokiarchaeota archaeon]
MNGGYLPHYKKLNRIVQYLLPIFLLIIQIERDDDWFILHYALNHNSYVITNIRFLEFRKKYPQYKERK